MVGEARRPQGGYGDGRREADFEAVVLGMNPNSTTNFTAVYVDGVQAFGGLFLWGFSNKPNAALPTKSSMFDSEWASKFIL